MDILNRYRAFISNTTDHYKRELWAASLLGRYTIETDLVAAGMNEIEKRLQQLHSNQRKLVTEKMELQVKETHKTWNYNVNV